jgi:hypothetical protein
LRTLRVSFLIGIVLARGRERRARVVPGRSRSFATLHGGHRSAHGVRGPSSKTTLHRVQVALRSRVVGGMELLAMAVGIAAWVVEGESLSLVTTSLPG